MDVDSHSVAIPSVNLPSTVTCLRSLGKKRLHTVLLTNGRPLPASASRYCTDVLQIPDPGDDVLEYRDRLLAIARREDVSTIIPVREADVYVLSRYERAFEDHVSVVVPSFDALYSAHDRLRLNEVARKAGVPAPKTQRLSDVRRWDSGIVIKSRYNLLTSDYVDSYPTEKVNEVDDIEYHEPGSQPNVEAIRDRMDHDPIVQEFVPRESEFMFAGLYDHGTPLATYQHEQIRGDSYVRGGGVYRKSTFDPELETVARRLLAELDWHGLACIEYIKDANTGEFKLLEINPRMWQSLASTVRAGADFPYYYWLQAMGRGEQIDCRYDLGVGAHFFHKEIGYLLSLIQDDAPLVERPALHAALWAVTVSCVVDPHFDYLQWDDPRPFVRDLRNTIGRLLLCQSNQRGLANRS